MTEEELTEWEHRSDVIKVLTSYEMGAWLHRRDKRLLQKIWDEIDARREKLKSLADDDWYAGKIRGCDCAIEIIKEHADRLKDSLYGDGMRHCIDIIDKYKSESEDIVVDEGKLALLEKTYDDFCKCEGGEGWLKIDGKEYSTDAGYAIDGMRIFMEVFKQRLAESEKKG